MTKSIKRRTQLNRKRAATEIIMFRSNPRYKGNSFLIVEGPNDQVVFDNLIDSKTCRVVFANGRDNVIASLDVLEKRGLKGVLGVIDADFWILNGTVPSSQNLFITDNHDLETMLIDSPALEKVLRQVFLKGKTIEDVNKIANALRDLLYEIGMTIGYLRWFCLQNNLPLGFSTLNFSSFIDPNLLTINLPELITRAKNPTQTCPISDKAMQRHVNSAKKSNKHPVLHVCHGKDLLEILAIILPTLFWKELKIDIKKKLARRKQSKIDPTEFDEQLRLAYEMKYFSKTKLYTSVKTWEENNPSYLVFDTG